MELFMSENLRVLLYDQFDLHVMQIYVSGINPDIPFVLNIYERDSGEAIKKALLKLNEFKTTISEFEG